MAFGLAVRSLISLLALAAVSFLVDTTAQGQTSLTTGTAYTQNFDTLASSSTSSTFPASWAFLEAGSGANTTYTAGTGSSATGDTYSFGVAGINTAADRALGSLTSGTVTPIQDGASFQNNTATTITALTIQYTGEQWRTANANTDKLDFAYSLDATSLSTGTWADVDALDFIPPNTSTTGAAVDGNASGNRTTLTFTIAGLSIPNGSTFWIRWTDVDITVSGAATDDGIGIDDFSLQVGSTTAVEMSDFTANSSAKGVVLEWKTGFEVNNLGFKVYRERKGKRVPINSSIIAGSALMAAPGTAMTAGNSYSWVDPDGTSDSVYYLEDIDIDGTRMMHGPVAPSAGDNSVSAKWGHAILLDELNAGARDNTIAQHLQRGRAFSAGSSSNENPVSEAGISDSVNKTASSDIGSQLSRAATTSRSQSQDKQKALAAMPSLKISVREDGWYRITQEALVAAGLNPNGDMRYQQLYADGVEIPIVINSSKATGPLKAGDSIEFYGVALDTPSADRREYWLVFGTTLGKRIKTQSLRNVSSGELLTSFEYTVERKERLLYFSGLLNGDTENFFGQVLNSGPIAQTFSVQHLNSVAASRLEVALQGVTLHDHVVKVLINGTEVGVLNFAGQQNKVAQFLIGAGVLREGDNTVTLERTNGDMDISLVDYLRLSYSHTYQADHDYLQFTVNGRAQVSGFSAADVVLLDTTDPNSVSLYNPKTEKAADGYRFTLQTSGTRTFLALADQNVGQPAALTRNQPSNWSANTHSADFVIITHRNFRNSVEPLAQLRRNEGMSVAVVDVEDVYDEFSYGAHDSRSIHDFLEWTQTHWTRVPRFVLLVGDGSYDPRNYLANNGDTDLMPAHLIDTAVLETVSDDWFVDFDNDGVGEIALGRLPVRTAIEADILVSKILNYSPANTVQSAVMVADSMDAKTNFNFEAASDELGSLLPATIGVQKIYRRGNATSVVHDQVINGINQGPLLVNFMGHGSVEVWTGGPILTTTDAATFNNGTRLPVFLMMTCLNGYYQNPARESLAESLVRADAGGAIAVWSSSGMTEPAPQFDMSRALYLQLFGSQPLRLGEAIRKAKKGNANIDVRRTWILFGDPTMRVR